MKGRTLISRMVNVALAVLLAANTLMVLIPAQPVQAAGNLTLTIIAAPNLVVDSNALSPSTYSPKVATVIAKVCNTGPDPVNSVTAYIGNYTGSGTGTPGIYPTITDATIGPAGTQTTYNGTYSFTHLGGTADAARFMGTLAVGECRYQYWSFEYPLLANGDTIPTWGNHVKPDDDLYLDFDMWVGGDVDGNGTVESTEYVDDTHRMTMRNEISAMANKIKPNGNPAGEWFNTDTSVVYPGQTVTTNGILYRLGNVNQGFDNDGDGVPDYNAWLQPFGDPAYDPSCFRLVGVTGVLTVTRGGGNPDMIIPIYNNLYFSNLPPDNTDVRGEVFYEFLALGGACTVPISPYQEAASGFDNEKFNGDYGTGVPALMSYEPEVDITKSAPGTQPTGVAFTYMIPFVNNSPDVPAGLTLSAGGVGVNAGLMISDTVPTGLQYVADSAGDSVAASTNSIPTGNSVTIYFSTDKGVTWTITDPGNYTSTSANPLFIQWWLDEPLDDSASGNNSGNVRYQAIIPSSGYSGPSFIENCAEASFGDAAPFDRACAITMVEGTGTIGDFVWRDEDNNGLQTDETTYGINGVTISLYWDRNGDGELDDDDMLLATQDTYTYSGNPGYYQFTQLPPGDFLVVVDSSDVQAQYTGYRVTTPDFYAVTLAAGGSDQTADFGFGPSLEMEKQMLPASDTCGGYEGREVRYSISLSNKRPGTGETVPGGCRYALWSSTGSTASAPKDFTDYYLAFGEPDDQYAYGDFAIGSNRFIQGTGFDPGAANGTIDSVQAVFRIYVDPAVPNDDATLRLLQGTTELATQLITNTTLNTYVGLANAGYIAWTIPSTSAPGGSWTWDDFPALTLELQPEKNGGGDSSYIYIDAIGFYANSSDACPAIDDNDIMTTVPLTDTYDTTYLEFVSASPAHTAVDTTNGVITWTNAGPIYPGKTKTVYVRFLAKDISGTSSVTVDNAAGSTGTRFADGGYANDVYDTASGTICQTGSINGYIYSDPDSSGWNYNSGAGDLPIPGIGVTIYGCYDVEEGFLITSPGNNNTCASAGGEWQERATMLTDANGYYEFNGLLDGFYYVAANSANLPGTVTQTAEADDDQSATGTLPNTTADGHTCSTGNPCNNIWGDPNAVLVSGNKLQVNPIDSAGETISGVNFGYHINPGVYGSIWEDNNGDGDEDNGEGPIGSVTVRLYTGSCGGTEVGSTSTDADGRYQFGDLTAGTTYYIAVDTTTLPGGASAWTQTGENDGSIDNCISFTAVAGTLSGSHDFGFRNIGDYTIGDTLYYDWNGDGTQNTNEEGIPNITVWLYEDSDGDGVVDSGVDALIATTTTDGDGLYEFTDLPADNYLVIVNTTDPDFPAGVVQTQDPDETGVCTTCDSRGKVTLGPSDDTVDFGYQPKGAGTIGDTVYRDMNGNGAQDLTETGIPNITVWLEVDLNGDGSYSRVMTATTGTDGNYLFSNLPDATYRVVVDTTDDDLPEDTYGHTYVPSTDTTTGPITISGGNTYLDADFGFVPLGAIGDFVWQDSNGDGLWENGEMGIPGVVIELYEDADNNGVADGPAIATATTDSNGLYLFSGLSANNYIVKVASSNFASGGTLEGYTLTGDPDSYNTDDPVNLSCLATGAQECDGENRLEEMTDKDGNSLSPPLYGLQPGQTDMSSDFGYQPPALIGDFIWQDLNGDGEQDPGEPGIAGVDVFLCNGSPASNPCAESSTDYVATATTNDDGYYYFTGQPAGTYSVTVDTGDLPAGMTQTGDPEGNNDNSGAADTTGSVSDLDMDFGYQGTAAVAGTLFFDIDNDGGLYGSGTGTDVPFAGVPVYLYDSTGALVGSTLTDDNGYYRFNVATGTYTIRVGQALSTRINGMTLTYEPDEAEDSGYCGSGSLTCNNATSVNTSDADALTQDFGYFAAIDMGDLPAGYNYTITMIEEGPIHINASGNLSPTIYLGTAWDSELDGAPDAAAGMNSPSPTTGDDIVGIDDEDGVHFLNTWQTGGTAQLEFTVTNNDTNNYKPYLVGWFDWDNNGDLYGNGEMAISQDIVCLPADSPCTVQIDVPIPSNAYVGNINMRFRIYATQSPPPVIAPTGTVINGEVEDYQRNNAPTAITLAAFEATPQDEAILVTWETAMELDHVGFNLYRSTAAAGPYTRINATLIPPQFPGEIMGGTYEWLDTDVEPGVTYFYKLEDLDLKGVSTLHGPVSTVSATAPTAVKLRQVSARSAVMPLALGLMMGLGLVIALCLTRSKPRPRDDFGAHSGSPAPGDGGSAPAKFLRSQRTRQ